jgi:protein farnesyltransferase subunit beta
VMCLQHPEGGFGGGPYQYSHLLTTYASVCTLAIVGRPGPGGGWDQIDRYVSSSRCRCTGLRSIHREKLYKFYMSLKQPDGSFLVAQDMEVDIRYALSLPLPLPSFSHLGTTDADTLFPTVEHTAFSS